MGSLALELRR